MGAGNLQRHYKATHGLSKSECDELGYLVYSQSHVYGKSELISGDKNPGKDHGGKLSPWSKKSDHYSEESHKKAIANSMKNPSNAFMTGKVETYTNQGYSLEESNVMVSKRQSTFSYEKCIEKYGLEEGVGVFEARQAKWLKSLFASLGKDFIPRERLPKLNHYYRMVWSYTNRNKKTIDRIELRSRSLHLDHIYSIHAGFINGVDPKIIGSVYNLRMIDASYNCSKRDKCDITLGELMSLCGMEHIAMDPYLF